MDRFHAARPSGTGPFRPGLLPLLLAFLAALPAGGEEAPGGRFLYAGDDDWDWATPLGAEEASPLARYGAMPWSALDWAEEHLEEVRGALVGTAPDPKKNMSMQELSDLRGEQVTYRHHAQAEGVIRKLLDADQPPNVIVLMQNTGKDGPLDPQSVQALGEFVRAGGRLVVLDDWRRYTPVLDALVEVALKLPPGPPIPEAAAPPADPFGDPVPKEEITPDAEPKAERSEEEQTLAAQLRDLLPMLGDESFKTREQGSERIRELGPKVLPLLSDVETEDPEVASRLDEIRKALAPAPQRKVLSKEAQRAARLAKIEAGAKLARDAASKLAKGKVSHRLSTASVDGDKVALPVLRISFPAP